MEVKEFQCSYEYENGIRVEWLCSSDGVKEEHFEPWFFDGSKRVPLLMSHLKSLPEEICDHKEGDFMKGNSDQTSWKLRYFVVRGGLMTYFKDALTSKPQGTIPLKGCSIDLPNDKRKSFLLRGRGRDADGYEIRITHASRRPFLLVFQTSDKRNEWVNFLTQYIAMSFLSKEYILAEKIKVADEGIYVTRRQIPISGSPTDVMSSDQKKCYLYIDWNSSSPSSWCLRYSSMKLTLSPYEESSIATVLENQPASISIPLTSIRGVEIGEFPSSTINVNVQGKTIYEFNPIVPSREVSFSWCTAIQSAMKLQDICSDNERTPPTRNLQRSTSPGRNSSRHISDLKSALQASVEPSVPYTRAQFLREERVVYRRTHPNEPLNSPAVSPMKNPSNIPIQQSNASLGSGLKRTDTLLSQESSLSTLLSPNKPQINNQNQYFSNDKDDGIDRIQQTDSSDNRRTSTTSTIVPRKVITQRGSSLGLGGENGNNSSNTNNNSGNNGNLGVTNSTSKTPFVSSQVSQESILSNSSNLKNEPKRSSIAAISSMISGTLGSGTTGSLENDNTRKSFSGGFLQSRRLSVHRKPSQDSNGLNSRINNVILQDESDDDESDESNESNEDEENENNIDYENINRSDSDYNNYNTTTTKNNNNTTQQVKSYLQKKYREKEHTSDSDHIEIIHQRPSFNVRQASNASLGARSEGSQRVNKIESTNESNFVENYLSSITGNKGIEQTKQETNQVLLDQNRYISDKEEYNNINLQNNNNNDNINNNDINNNNNNNLLQYNQLLQDKVESDASALPVRRRHRKKKETEIAGYSTPSYSEETSPLTKSETDHSISTREYSHQRSLHSKSKSHQSSIIKGPSIVVEYHLHRFLLTINSTHLSLIRLKTVETLITSFSSSSISLSLSSSTKISTMTSVEAIIPILDQFEQQNKNSHLLKPFLLNLQDCVTAEIDINATGLIRLTFRKNSLPNSSISPSYYNSNNINNNNNNSNISLNHTLHNNKSNIHQKYYSLILKCINGHQDAVEWIKELNLLKLQSIQNSSAYRNRTPTK